jgi:hypothetical protein
VVRAWTGRAVAALALVTACVPAPPPPGPAPGCGPGWTTAEQANRVMSGSPIVDVRAGVHECFDRIVVDLRGTVPPGYAVRYVDRVTQLASGEPISLRGGAFMELVVWAPAVDEQMRSTYPKAGQSELVSTAGFGTLRQVAWGGYQEGLTLFAVGLQARTTFHVWILPGPGATYRLIVDIAHR